MSKSLKITLLSAGAIAALAVALLTYLDLTASDRETQRRIDGIGGETQRLQEERERQQQP